MLWNASELNGLSPSDSGFNLLATTYSRPAIAPAITNPMGLPVGHAFGPLGNEPLAGIRSIVFIDGQLSTQTILGADLQADLVVTLEANLDGVKQIGAVLAQYDELQSVHLISHGSVGNLRLGNTALNGDSLGLYATELQQWATAFSPEGDLLIYGCDVAAGETGLAFVQQLSQLTGADVAASQDLTGSAVLGGDWQLEVTTGAIEASLALTATAQQTYEGVLAAFNYTTFGSTAGLRLNGNTTQVGTALQLTPGLTNQRGSTFYTEAIALTPDTSFSSQFQIQLSGGNGAGGADGLAFVLQNTAAGAAALGTGGGSLGYGGLGAASIAIKFDTFDNGTDDPNSNHVGLLQGGAMATVVSGTPSFDLNGVSAVNAWVDYNGVNDRLDVFVSTGTSKPTTALFSRTIDLAGRLGSQMFVGFTAATGGLANAHQVRSWSFNSDPVVNNPANTIAFQTATSSGSEGTSPLNLTVVRSGNTSAAASVGYTFSNGTATNGTDYTGTAGTVSFAAGETSKTIAIPILNDTLSEANETFQVQLLNPQGLGTQLGATTQSTVTILDNDGPVSTGTGLRGEYFNNRDFTSPVLTRIDPTIDFVWGSGSPAPSIDADTFSVRWTGQVQAQFSETYTFFTTTDDGVRLRVNDELIIDGFRDQSPTELSGTIALVAGQRYDIQLEYYENGGGAVAQLGWASASTPKQIIPTSQLFAPAGSSSLVGWQAPTYSVSEGTATVSATLVRTGDTTGTASVTYTLVNGTATAGSDYGIAGPNTGSVNFAAGQTTATIAIPIADDTTIEGAETFQIMLSAPQNATLAGSTTTVTIFDNDVAIGTGDGLRGEYFDNINFTNPVLTRIDPTVNFDWAGGSPAANIGVDTFSVRWTGQVQAQFSETYTFFTTADDGVRLWVNDQLVIDNYVDQAPTERSGTIALVAGQRYNIRLEYYENGGGAVAQLAWASSSTPKQIIPRSQLYSPVVSGSAAIALEQNTYSVNEAGSGIDIAVVRTGDTSSSATVQYRIDPNTATVGGDYTFPAGNSSATGLVTFAPGQTRQTFRIPIINDSLVETTETFNVVVLSPTGADLGTIRTATVTILDDDNTTLTISAPQVNENAGVAIVTLNRGNSSGPASLSFSTANGTAIANSDYTATTGQVTFAVGETSKTIAIPLINDTVGEPNETFAINFSNPVGLTLSQTSTTVAILDDDPGTFSREVVISGLTQPTAFAWAPNTNQMMFILEKSGLLKVAELNASGQWVVNPTPFADLSQEVNDNRDRGALGLAVHPDFGRGLGRDFVYVAYTYDPPQVYLNTNPSTNLDDPDQSGNRPARVVQLQGNAATGLRTAVINPNLPNLPGAPARTNAQRAIQTVIVGSNSTWANTSRPDGNSTTDFGIPESGRTATGGYVQDYIKTDSESHTIGQLAFGADGLLYISVGDGTSYNAVDPRTRSVLDVNSLSGKILRVDPLTGQGVSSNPFWDGNANSNRSKVLSLGLRNPFRTVMQPGTNNLFIGDVGWGSWEEVNVAAPGRNFGWPAYEGGRGSTPNTFTNLLNGGYGPQAFVQGFINQNASIWPAGSTNFEVTAPIFARDHSGDGARAIIIGDFYTGNTFPSVYNNALFITDANQGLVQALTLDANNRVVAVRTFASGLPGIVQMRTGSDGNLYYVNLGGPPGTGTIQRWRPS